MKSRRFLLMMLFSITMVSCKNENVTSSSQISDSSSTSSSVSSSSSTSSSSSSTSSSSSSTSSSSSSTTSSSSPISEEDNLAKLDEVIGEALDKATLIKSGVINISTVNSYSNTNSQMTYEYGVADFHYTEPDFSNQTQNIYLVKDEEGTIVPILELNGQISKPYTTYTELSIPFTIFGYGSETYYGIENLVSGLYNAGKTNENQDLSLNVENDEYTIAYGKIVGDSSMPQFYKINMSFTLGEEKEFQSVNLTAAVYNNDQFLFDDELGVVQLNPNATPNETKTWEITQVVGNREQNVCPYSLEDFYATSFDLVYNNTVLEENASINMEIGSFTNINLENIMPTTTNFNFDNIQVLSESPNISGYYDSWGGSISLNANDVGEYEVTIKSKNVTKNLTVIVAAAQPTEISVTYFVKGVEAYDTDVLGKEYTNYVNDPFYVMASVTPYMASQEYEVSVVDGDSNAYSIEDTTITNMVGMLINVKKIVFSQVGKYTLKFESAVKEDVTFTSTINVVNKPSLYEILQEEYAAKQFQGITHLVSFAPEGDGTLGSATIEDKVNNMEYVCTYQATYDESFGGYLVKFFDENNQEISITIKISGSYKMKLYQGIDSYDLQKVTPELLISGTWTTKRGTTDISIGFTSNGTASVNIFDSATYESTYFECDFTIAYNETENYYEITFATNDWTGNVTIINFSEKAVVDEQFSELKVNFYFDTTGEEVTLTPQSMM